MIQGHRGFIRSGSDFLDRTVLSKSVQTYTLSYPDCQHHKMQGIIEQRPFCLPGDYTQ